MRHCSRLVVTYDDARSVGYCEAGIEGWQGRYGISGTEATASAVLATGSDQARRVVEAAAKRVAIARLAEHK